MRAATVALCLTGAAMFGQAMAAGEPPVSQPQSQAATSNGSGAGAASRLKFRNGTSCMCATGMSEADIQKAEQARFRELRQKRDDGGNYKN